MTIPKPQALPNNYYALKRNASLKIKETVEYLAKHPNKRISLAELSLHFSTNYGFSSNVMMTLIQPYVQLGHVWITHDQQLTSTKAHQ